MRKSNIVGMLVALMAVASVLACEPAPPGWNVYVETDPITGDEAALASHPGELVEGSGKSFSGENRPYVILRCGEAGVQVGFDWDRLLRVPRSSGRSEIRPLTLRDGLGTDYAYTVSLFVADANNKSLVEPEGTPLVLGSIARPPLYARIEDPDHGRLTAKFEFDPDSAVPDLNCPRR